MALGKRGYNRQRRIRAGKQSNPFLQGKLPSLSNLRGLNLIFFFFFRKMVIFFTILVLLVVQINYPFETLTRKR